MKRLLAGYAKLEKGVFGAQKVLLIVMVTAIVLINIAQVAGRYLFHFSLPWSEQLSVLLFVCIVVLGGNIAIKTDDEIKIDLLNFKNPTANRVTWIVRDVMGLVALVILLVSGFYLTKHVFQYSQIISSLKLNYAWAYLVMTVGFGMMIIDKLMRLLSRFVREEPAAGEGESA